MFRSKAQMKQNILNTLAPMAGNFARQVPLNIHYPNIKQVFQTLADNYINKRAENPKPYKTHDIFKKGYTPTEKQDAIQALLNLIDGKGNVTEEQLAVLRNGSLGRKIRLEIDTMIANRVASIIRVEHEPIHKFVEFLQFYHYNTPGYIENNAKFVNL